MGAQEPAATITPREALPQPKPEPPSRYAKGEIRPIKFWPDKGLKEGAVDVPEVCFKKRRDKASLRKLVSDLVTTMYATGGVGLSATQVGEGFRIFVCDVMANVKLEKKHLDGKVPGSNLIVAINPEIVPLGDKKIRMVEACLSFPNVTESIERSAMVRFRARSLKGDAYEVIASGSFGRIVQHEFDHLDGIVFLDRMGPMTKRHAVNVMKKFRRRMMRDQLRVRE